MKPYAKILFVLIALFFFITPIPSIAKDYHLQDDVLQFPFEISSSITFSMDSDDELVFDWSNKTFKIKYPKGKLDEAGKKFVEWLETYMDKENYCDCKCDK